MAMLQGFKIQLGWLWFCLITLYVMETNAFQLLVLTDIVGGSRSCPLQSCDTKNVNTYYNIQKSIRIHKRKKDVNFMQLKNEENKEIYIRFSRAFQKHVVIKCRVDDDSCSHHDCNYGEVIKSYVFLDDAITCYPNAQFVKLRDVIIDIDDILILAGMGTISSTEMIERTVMPSPEIVNKSLAYLKSLSSTQQRKPISNLLCTVSPLRFAAFTQEKIHRNYDRVMDLLTRGRNRNHMSRNAEDNNLFSMTKVGLAFGEAAARTVIAEFPQLCLYDIHELEDRIKFFISPQVKVDQDEDCE